MPRAEMLPAAYMIESVTLSIAALFVGLQLIPGLLGALLPHAEKGRPLSPASNR
jgi:hypothetical protein